jgi:putative ABC transport system permease protein
VNYRSEGLLTIMMSTPDLNGHYDAIRNDLLATGVVDNMAESSCPTTDIWSNQIGFNWEGKDPNTLPSFGIMAMTADFGKTIGWKIKEGRDFSRDFVTDTLSMILNESGVKQIGMKDDIVGKIIQFNDKKYTVVGVVKDMIMQSPYKAVTPTVFLNDPNWANVITIAIKPGTPTTDALSKIEPVFKKYNPSAPFDYKFNDEDYAKKFEDEQRVGNLASFFTILAIFISCLGLFGLASFVAEQRKKEIGVRKVLGASVYNLWKMLSKEFALLVIISCFIAIPLAWYYLNGWLKQYDYRTGISFWIFILSGAGALLITLLTVSFQAIKAAIANPVNSLRTE